MKLHALSLTALVALTGSSCTAVGEDHVAPVPEAGAATQWNGRLDGVLTDADLDPEQLAEWWTTFEDAALTSLVERATQANLDLRTANAQLRQARAQRQIAAAAGSPNVGKGAGATRTETDAGTAELFSASLDASWELDLFGGNAREIEAADADLQVAEEARRDMLVTVLSEVALNYIDLLTTARRLEVAQANLASQEDGLTIIKAKLDAGAVTQIDFDSAVASLESTRSTLPALEQESQRIKNRIAVLLGQNPGTLEAELADIQPLRLPSVEIAVGVPAQVLRRRPDVRRSERKLAAETARVGVAIAELYPKLTLGGTIGLEASSSASLFDAASRVFSLGPRLQWNLFDGGRTRQQIEVQGAVQEQALVDYERTILTALEDVENAVTAFAQEQLRHRSLQTASDSAQRAAQLAETRYLGGETDYLAVLDAPRSRLGAQDELARSEGVILSNLVRLYKALGGGWNPLAPQPPAEK